MRYDKPIRIHRIYHSIFALGAAGAMLLAGCGGGGNSASAGSGDNTRDVVFQVQPGTDVGGLAREYGVTIVDSSPENNLYTIRLPNGQQEDQFSEHLRKDKRFSAAEPDSGVHAPETRGTVEGFPIHVPFDFVTTRDTRFAALARAYSAATDSRVNPTADQQVDLGTTLTRARGTGITVAVLDTGVQADHPSLRSHLLSGYNALSPQLPPDDIADGTTNQAQGHGTMVAGIIAALAPEAKILPVRVLNADGTGSIFGVVRGLRWATAQGAKVINLSFGTATASGILQNAIQEARHAGAIVVAAAGNAGKETVDYPAATSGVLGVASVEADDTRSSYSNLGSWVSLSAPGSGITSTYIGGGFATWSGTSFAAPFVSAAAALTRGAHPDLSSSDVEKALVNTARPVDENNPDYRGKIGRGVVDISRAVGM